MSKFLVFNNESQKCIINVDNIVSISPYTVNNAVAGLRTGTCIVDTNGEKHIFGCCYEYLIQCLKEKPNPDILEV